MDLSFAAGIIPHPIEAEKVEQKRIWQRFSLSRWIGRDDPPTSPPLKHDVDSGRPSIRRRLSRKIIPELPRPATFRRQNSERRDRLTPVQRKHVEPRAASVDRRRAMSARPPSPTLIAVPKLSAPAICNVDHGYSPSTHGVPYDGFSQTSNQPVLPGPMLPPSPPPDVNPDMSEDSYDNLVDDAIQVELEEKWILNLSMHFRDRSPREKFFVTFAETPTRWRRVTVSCNYRDSPPDSLERDLQSLQYQRDKSARIYEAIRMSLTEIQFYNTVTNLKLETSPDDRLHVHVTEDVNEIIPYPSVHAVQHLHGINTVFESDVNFISHTSGFVYKVRVQGQVCIKKEIPGPDSVDEFLYEVNALHAMIGSQHVIQFRGLVVDERDSVIKGLLISYAEQGSLVDTLYDYKGHLSWGTREKWARQIISGLSEIHEAGFVQGDFTLSNIVIDVNNDAYIIDINRRGCPVGWEPPEIQDLISSGQRISTYIGVKSDLFQLGMVLWGLAEEEDEPERQPRPLQSNMFSSNPPQYFQDLVDTCLRRNPRDRLAAKELLTLFPKLRVEEPRLPLDRRHSLSVPSETQYIDPRQAVEREDLDLHNRDLTHRGLSSDSHTYVDRPGSADQLRSLVVTRRGRQPAIDSTAHGFGNQSRSDTRDVSAGQSEQEEPQIIPISPNGAHRYNEFEVGGVPYIIPKDSFEFESEDVGQSRRLRTVRRQISSSIEGETPEQEGLRQLLSIDHTDSGLADMDLTLGVGGHEALGGYHMRAAERLRELDTDDRGDDNFDGPSSDREEEKHRKASSLREQLPMTNIGKDIKDEKFISTYEGCLENNLSNSESERGNQTPNTINTSSNTVENTSGNENDVRTASEVGSGKPTGAGVEG